MKMFTKLALVSSMAISANAMAMQSMDDAALSAATGQDGINIGIGISKIEIEKVLIHDNDGLGGTAANAGAIVIKSNGTGATAANGIVITAPMDATGTAVDNTRALTSHNLADLTIDTDKGTGTNGAFLNVAAAVSGLDIYIGEIGVSGSNAASTTVRRGNDASNYNAILSGLTIKTGLTSANIQLGAAPQGAMIVLNTTMQGGLEIKNLGIVDSSTKTGTADGTAGNRAAGQIFLDSIKVSDASNANLTVNAAVSVVGKEGSNNGYLRIITGSGATTPKTDMYIKGVHLGSQAAASIGDVEVQGLQTYYFDGTANVKGSMITISGH
ncbi:putative pilus system protein FilA [Acinetobacter modestus]|uniref:putative pilus system protein FilA n=1 Tax=Acinetobacter modestus TaxID=1776740 RepID=UPI00320BB2A0